MRFSKISIFSLNIKLSCNELDLGSGTGFFYERNGDTYLITNYHVLTCREPKHPESLLKNYRSSPDLLTFNLSALAENEFGVISTISIPILPESRFLEHKNRTHGIDLVALKIDLTSLQKKVITTQLDLGLVDDIPIEITSNLFIVGYPWGFSPMPNLPVWKKGTIASEPNIVVNDAPQIYVDSFTHPGMSGSPVFASEDRDRIIVDKKTHELHKSRERGEISALDFITNVDPDMLQTTRKLKHFRIIGVYSGRVSNGNFDPQIGIVWPIYLVDEIIDDGVVATNPYPAIKVEVNP